jgi:uncharacterized protein YlxP (DUF503 family)
VAPFAGLLVLDLHFPGSKSLKDKRAKLRSVKAHLGRAGCSVSEVAYQDSWQRSQLAVSVVGGGAGDVDGRLTEAVAVCERVGIEATTLQRTVMSFDELED